MVQSKRVARCLAVVGVARGRVVVVMLALALSFAVRVEPVGLRIAENASNALDIASREQACAGGRHYYEY
jgi:hypothetical protein